MFDQLFREALIPDRTKNPERTASTFERIREILINVLGDRGKKIADTIQKNASVPKDRIPVNPVQADGIIRHLNSAAIDASDLENILNQLQYSEISTREALDLHRRYKIPVSHLEDDLVPVRGEGCWVMDTTGKWYLDMDSNYSATNLGMNNPEIARGLFNQASLLISMKEDRVQIARTRFLREIKGMMPPGLDYFYWQNSGGEAVDKALKFAKAHTGSRQVVAFRNGFHGRTHGAVSVTFNKKYRVPFGLDQENWVHFAEFNDIESVRNIIDRTGARILIMEMIQGEEAGNLPADPAFIRQLWKLKKEKGLVIIDDEVQAGFGRSATRKGEWFACMGYGVTPDIMTIGKSFGGGYPVTAVVTGKRIAASMSPGFDGSTFGGNPMAMTCALIATRQMREKDITGNVIERSVQFSRGLGKLKKKHPVIEDIRIRGLMVAFSIGTPQKVLHLQQDLKELGVKTSLSTGPYVRFLPPTIINREEVEKVLQKLDLALEKLPGR